MLPDSLIFGSAKIKLDAIGSTNDFARDLLTKGDEILEGTVVIAENQQTGRGQRGNSWVSEAGMNLTFSVVLFPKFLSPSDQFELSKAISLGIINYLRDVLPVNMTGVRIKWPNDIYVGNEKICGILIENAISGSKILHAVVGIGLNVNQDHFEKSLANPTSMKLVSGEHFELEHQLSCLLGYLDRSYVELRNRGSQKLNNNYVKNLYRYKELAQFKIGNQPIQATIIGVDGSGKLILEKENKEQMHADFQEVKFVNFANDNKA